MENCKDLWVEKYRPTTLGDYVLHADIKDYFRKMIDGKQLQNCMFSGPAGSGKTTLARILAKEFDAETLFVPCATDGTLDVLRTRIQDFCNAMSFDGKVKVVILDELDSASSSSVNNFQLGLRTVLEAAADNTRFIATCNYQAKIVPAILSRCPIIPLKFDKKDLLLRIKYILDSEKIEYSKDSMRDFVEDAFQYYPDCRRIISYLQLCCNGGKLVVKLGKTSDVGGMGLIRDIAEKAVSCDDMLEVRRFYLQNKDKISDFVEAGSFLFEYAVDNGLVNSCDGMLALSDKLFQLNQVIDKETGFFAMLPAVKKYAAKRILKG